MGKKSNKKNKESKNFVENLAYGDSIYYPSTDENSVETYEDKYKKKYKKLKKLEEKMNKTIDELQLSKDTYDKLIVELKTKREELNRLLELTNTVHNNSKNFLNMQKQMLDEKSVTTLPFNNES